jgi:DNA-directed RNA polymerase specialized sigma24 family protein
VAEAFAIAAEHWPKTGIPPKPGGWITTTARNRAIDRLRRESTRSERHLAAHRLRTDSMDPDHNPELDRLDELAGVVADDQLRLMFLCAHPALAADAQVALTLRLLGGLETSEIARAFLVPEATMAQRIVRAKRKLHDNHASYRIPRAAELPDRLHAVLAAIYLIYTEGHTATSGQSLTRTNLSTEAIRLGRTPVSVARPNTDPSRQYRQVPHADCASQLRRRRLGRSGDGGVRRARGDHHNRYMRATKRRHPLRRRIVAPPAGVDLAVLAGRASYVGSSEHKTFPSFAGPFNPRADASKCDPKLAEQEELTRWLREAITAGQCGQLWEGDFP